MKKIKQGFTLVELMIVVAIIGILAAIAVPNFYRMQLRAKRAELFANVDGIKTASQGYAALNDVFISAPVHPSVGTLGKQTRAWGSGNGGFRTLGWEPDGNVRGSYGVLAYDDEGDGYYGEGDDGGREELPGPGGDGYYPVQLGVGTVSFFSYYYAGVTEGAGGDFWAYGYADIDGDGYWSNVYATRYVNSFLCCEYYGAPYPFTY